MNATLEIGAENRGQQDAVSAETAAAVAAPRVVIADVAGSGGGQYVWPRHIVVAVLQPGTVYRARNARNVIAYREVGSYNGRNSKEPRSQFALLQARAEAIRAEMSAKYAA
jgi:hypothetical protein